MAVFERIVWVVLDSVGIGELPDAADYGDVGRNTLGHCAESRPLAIPNLLRLGLANIDRKSTRLNSSHQIISYAVFCLKKKNRYKCSVRSVHTIPIISY